jgi:uncharacterized secreted protein with C-terminal beta-propeller domain
MRTTYFMLVSWALLALGCGSQGGNVPHHEPEHPVGSNSEPLLTETNTCSELLDSVQQDALAKIEMRTQQYLRWYTQDRGMGTADSGASGDGRSSGAESAAPSDDATPDDYSETNNQVEGVSEADIVKTDGEHIYLLSGNKLFILKSWPAEQTSIEAQFTLEGYAHEMFVAHGRAVVFSQTSDPRNPDDDGRCANRYESHGYYYPCYSGGTQYTKITVADLNQGAPQLSREVYIQGHYNTARRHDRQVRAVINNWGRFFGWNLPRVYEYLQTDDGRRYYELSAEEARERIYAWRSDAIDTVLSKGIEEWLPTMMERVEGSLSVRQPQCSNFYMPQPGRTSYGMTQIAGIHMTDASQPLTRTGIWGQAHEAYANHEAMILAQRDYSTWYRAYHDEQETYSDWTILHRFGIGDSGSTQYEASGIVPGSIADQFSIDARDGVTRVATTQTTRTAWWAREPTEEWTPPTTTNQVLTLRNGDNRRLETVGSTGNLVEDERIFSARFMGDMAYVVTFRQVDPLFAIDLSNPEQPEVLGELKIPGFSDYMHPLDENHLLTIGRDADEDGRTQGLALQIFDITDPTEPKRDHKYVFSGDEWGYSDANWDHKAFTFYDSRDLLAFPYVAWGSDYNSYRSSLEVFRVGADSGFNKVGSIDHSPLLEGMCEGDTRNYQCRYYGMRVRRGVFIEDYIYSISYGGVRVHDSRDMSRDVATVELPRNR